MPAQSMAVPQPDFRLLFESAPDAYLVLNADLVIIAVSDAYLRVTMTEREVILGQYMFDVFPDNPDDPTVAGVRSVKASLERVLSTGAADAMAVQQYAIRQPQAEGSSFENRYWSPINSPVLGADGQVLYIIHRVEDVTSFIHTKNRDHDQQNLTEAGRIHRDRVEAEIYSRAQDLQQANHDLRTSNDHLTQSQAEIYRLNNELEERIAERTAELVLMNKELESFNYSVSHDLRTPLRALDGFSQAVLEDYGDQLDAEGRHYLQRIRLASQRMSQVIDDLLNLSRISRQGMAWLPVDISQIVTDILAELQATHPNRVTNLSIEPGLVVSGDHNLLALALQNLLDNAWKFTGKNETTRIEFGAETQDEKEVFFVRDNGVGFDMAYVHKLFVPFQRLHTLVEFEGTGIGLATVQRIIHRHGGHIWVESTPNTGTTFYFTLDAA